jgi:tetratricopeptide (TPR) repeat protein
VKRALVVVVLAFAGCNRATPALNPPADRPVAPASAKPAPDAGELDRLEADITRAPDDHALVDRYRETALRQSAGVRAQRWLEQLAADPVAGKSANVHYQLGMAYIDAVKTAPPTTKSVLAGRALTAFDAALARDPLLWDAAYAKGLVYLRMPASFKQYPKAIDAFVDLLKRQERQPPRPEFALTYARLSEAYSQGDDRTHARKVLEDGLGRFPNAAVLRERLAAIDAEARRR